MMLLSPLNEWEALRDKLVNVIWGFLSVVGKSVETGLLSYSIKDKDIIGWN